MQNPVKAGLCIELEDYKWSSYCDYIDEQGITDVEFVLELFSKSSNGQMEEFEAFIHQKNEDRCLEIEEKKKRMTDEQINQMILEKFHIQPLAIQNEPRDNMGKILKRILEIEGISTRQLARITGVSANIIWKL